MRIVIEALGIGEPGGARTGILNTIKELPQVAPNSSFIVYLSRFESTLENFSRIEQRILPASNRFAARLQLQLVLPRVIKRDSIDVVHFTKNLVTGFVACPSVVSVHDLTTLRYPETHHRVDVAYWRWIEPIYLRRVNRIIAVSSDVANDLKEIYGLPRERIRVIRWAPDDRFRSPIESSEIERVRSKYGLPEQFILFIGILAKKKNLKTLLRSMAHLHGLGLRYNLVIAGRRYAQSDASSELDLIKTLQLEASVRHIGPVLDVELPALYAASGAFVLPSLHEGFGIPCWEAMAVGVPVIASRQGALAEVVGDAGILIDDPLDFAAFAQAIRRVMESPALRADLIERGRRRISDRSWRTVAAETWDTYQSVYRTFKQFRLESGRLSAPRPTANADEIPKSDCSHLKDEVQPDYMRLFSIGFSTSACLT